MESIKCQYRNKSKTKTRPWIAEFGNYRKVRRLPHVATFQRGRLKETEGEVRMSLVSAATLMRYLCGTLLLCPTFCASLYTSACFLFTIYFSLCTSYLNAVEDYIFQIECVVHTFNSSWLARESRDSNYNGNYCNEANVHVVKLLKRNRVATNFKHKFHEPSIRWR